MSLLFFNTIKNYYIYDSNSNKIFEVERPVWEEIKAGKRLPELEYFAKKGFLTDNNNRNYYKFSFSQLKEQLSSSIEKITIEITQKCNFSCHYCPYNENFHIYNDRSFVSMSMKNIDSLFHFIKKHTEGLNDVAITFYGGEPLLEIRKIKSVTEILKETIKKKIHWGVVTNGALLIEEDISKFLAHNNFVVIISLDGPSYVHDKFRKDKKGNPTFEKIINGIRIIYKHYKKKFYKYIKFNVVLTPYSDLELLKDFFNNFEYVDKHTHIIPYFVSLEGANEKFKNEILKPLGFRELQ